MNVFSSRRYLPLQIALWVLPLAGVVWWATNQRAPTLPHTAAGFLELLAALALYAVVTFARAERWHAILVAEGINAPRKETHSLTVVGYMGNNALPARAGEILRVFLLSGRTDASKRTILGSIIVERLLDAVALGLLFFVVAYNMADDITVPDSPILIGAVGVFLVLGVVLAIVLARRAHLRERAVAVLGPMLAPARQLSTWRGLGLLLFSLGIWFLEAGVYVLVALAVDLPLSIADGLAIVAFTNLAALIPAAPGYIGTYDAAVLFATKAVTSVSNALALSYLLLLRFVLFVPITIAGLIILFVRYGGLRKIKQARAAEREAITGEHELVAPVTGEHPAPRPAETTAA
jgi:glycosyltransferase 2 family protein